MPGPKFPQGYPSYYHDIAARLLSERPARLEVDMPIQAGYARSSFNYFRQSWLRWYEFLDKKKDHHQANVALSTYNGLVTYSVQISPPRTLIFLSKEARVALEMRSSGEVEVSLSEWLPKRDDHVEAHANRKGRIKMKDWKNIPSWDGKQQDAEVAAALGIKSVEKPAPIIDDNPPKEPMSNKYGIPIGPPKDWNKAE